MTEKEKIQIRLASIRTTRFFIEAKDHWNSADSEKHDSLIAEGNKLYKRLKEIEEMENKND